MPARHKKDDDKVIFWWLGAGAIAFYLWQQSKQAGADRGIYSVTGTPSVTDTGAPITPINAPPDTSGLPPVTTTTVTPPAGSSGTIVAPAALANVMQSPIPLLDIGSVVSANIQQAFAGLPAACKTPTIQAQLTQLAQQNLSGFGTDIMTPQLVAQAVARAAAQVAASCGATAPTVTPVAPSTPVSSTPGVVTSGPFAPSTTVVTSPAPAPAPPPIRGGYYGGGGIARAGSGGGGINRNPLP